ncbi:26S proteasome non-ATPase regulatory subunit 9-like [Bolinopsis microptera]|uniref:26S proteasome non-ATPase regulatory subunit 9-like n=1 Tax=Bolinopsis microptera TaxID=2820187 RepID=UPI003079BB84
MDGPLVDKDQYPRSDIDVVAVRTARQQVIRLTNDMRGVMGRIERALYKLHELAPPNQSEGTETRERVLPPTRPPFLRVHGVIPNSPAHSSGLRDEDTICQIGSLHRDNFTNLGDVAEVVKLSVNKAVPVKLIRGGTPKTIALKPRPWQGRGVLGCNVAELTVEI